MKKKSNAAPKKKWSRPKLTILSRGLPEEGVLLACKLGGGYFGPGGTAASCSTYDYWSGCINTCSAFGSS